MKIATLIKQVHSTESKIEIKEDSPFVSNPRWIISPYDEFTLELSLKAKEHFNSSCTVFTLGPEERTTSSLRSALALGADRAVSINAEDDIGDSMLVSKILSQAISKMGGFELIFAGCLSIDQNQSSVGSMVASYLGFPSATFVSHIDYGKYLTIKSEVGGGKNNIVKLKPPCVITATKGPNLPRYPKLPDIMKAKRKPIEKIDLEDLDLFDSKTEFFEFKLPQKRKHVKMIEGSKEEISKKLVLLLRDEAKII